MIAITNALSTSDIHNVGAEGKLLKVVRINAFKVRRSKTSLGYTTQASWDYLMTIRYTLSSATALTTFMPNSLYIL